MEIDPRFKAARKNARKRRRRGWTVPLAYVSVIVALAAGGTLAAYMAGYLRFGPSYAVEDELQVDASAQIDNAASYNSAFADLAGDPMVLRFDTTGTNTNTRATLRPPEIEPARAGSNVVILSDEMVTSKQELITTLPSSREDFAFFQSQKTAAATPAPKPINVADEPAAPTGEVVEAEGEEASWGDDLEGVESGAVPDSYTKTRIEDTTSLTFILPENRRLQPYEDVILKLEAPTDLVALMKEKGFDAAASQKFVDDGKLLVPEIAALVPGHVLAMRAAMRSGVKMPVQLSLYTRNSYAGSLAINDAGQVVVAVDPWVEEDLFSFAGEDADAVADIGRKYRLLDAFYSAAIRNGVPSAVVAETIVMLSQSFDLEAFAAPGDKMTLVYAEAGNQGPGPGQVLYAAIKGEGRDLQCHVFLVKGTQDYACFKPGGGAGSGGGTGGLRSGLQTPVQGVLTSRFGPRMHPVLKVAKLHKGVDWAAPIGTPVMAAFGGVIASAGDGKGYGNLVRITHPGNGLETRYAHLNAFADGIKTGVEVTAGQLIGYVGTTGLSTGPHLHFEVYETGEAVDPLGAAGNTVALASGDSGSAVETLVDQIVHVESGGNATAKNPLSSATGLGQFIESTWIRMMKQYRPDLASTMDRASLLALRNDPTLSREMVTALAREGEAYLRNRGHSITAGRLYLCHFLGAEGANMVLNAQDVQLVGDVMGSGVISANPFLKGRTIAYVKEWAELKMNKKFKGGGASAPAVAVVPPEVLAYQKVIDALLAAPI